MEHEIHDPDLFRLFENAYPNTIDTAIKWQGTSDDNDHEELCFVITGDIDAMWIRDSAHQIAPYKYVLKGESSDVASLFRGVINLQARYLIAYPYCNSFQPPPESEIKFRSNAGGVKVNPPIDHNVVFTCNFELDDFGAFLQVSWDYFSKTEDLDFFGAFHWVEAIESILTTVDEMRQPTYASDGTWMPSKYTYSSLTKISTGTLGKNGFTNPVNDTGLVRSPFRPSDDASVYDFLIPANMMLSRYLDLTSSIMAKLPEAPPYLAENMRAVAAEIRHAIESNAIVTAPNGKKIYAYEVDGFGGQNLMDDANVPSLLSAPLLGYLDRNDQVYQNTREFVLSRANPWWCEGALISAVGSPHVRPGAAWPMASIVRAMTSDDDFEIANSIQQVLRSTNDLGLVHESVDSRDAGVWSRQWFTWANGLFAQMILDLAERKPHILQYSFQPGPIMADWRDSKNSKTAS